jgi:hypothetical protein
MKKVTLLVILGMVTFMLADCIASYPTFGPPGGRGEVVIRSPGPGYIWIAGYWGWGGGRYYWVPGRWVRGRRGQNWVDGRWEQQGKRYVWRKGHWR